MGSTGANQPMEDALVPIIFGVTGHRDLQPEDLPYLEQRVREIFLAIQSKYKNSPIALLSPLAEGADRLVAKVALEIGANLIVPLPMPAAEYEKDFIDSTSKSEFADLRSKSSACFELPLVEENTLQSISKSGPERDRQYEQVGAYIAQHSQILIALWNGVDDGKVAGTAAVVRFKFQGVPAVYAASPSVLSRPESGPVYHVRTPRISNPRVKGVAFEVDELYPDYWGEKARAQKAYDQMLRCVDEFNADVRRNHASMLGNIADSRSYVVTEDQLMELAPGLRVILDRYAVSDVMAQMFQKMRFRTIRGLYGLVLVSFLVFQIYLEFWRTPGLLLPYPILSMVAIAWYLYARSREYERKHQDYRALAEAIRVQFFWSLTGVGANAADHYLRKHKGELEWIRYAIRVWGINGDQITRTNPNTIALAQAQWVVDQAKWFRKRSGENATAIRKYHRSSQVLFIASLSLAFVLLLLELFGARNHQVFEVLIHPLMIFAIVSPLAAAATIQGYLEKLVLSEQLKQYERMTGIYEFAAVGLQKAIAQSQPAGALAILLELGKEALTENGDWILLHRARPLDLPIIEANLHP